MTTNHDDRDAWEAFSDLLTEGYARACADYGRAVAGRDYAKMQELSFRLDFYEEKAREHGIEMPTELRP